MANTFENVGQSSIFKDRKPLNHDYEPSGEEIVCRDEQIQRLSKILQDVIRYGEADNFIVTGDTGAGKTCTTKNVVKDLQDASDKNIQTLYLNDLQNERGVLLKISDALNLGFRGQSSLHQYYDLLEKKLKEEEIYLVLLLDEIEQLFQKDSSKDHGNTLLKRLWEVRKQLANDNSGFLQIVGITNNTQVPDFFDPKVDSRFGRKTVHFPSYNAIELRKILNIRAEKAFRTGALQEGVVSKAGALVAQEDGDARKAIELLRIAGEVAEEEESEKVRKQHVDEAESRFKEKRLKEIIRDLAKQEKVILYSVLEKTSGRESHCVTSSLHSQYEKVVREFEISKALTQRRVADLTDKLDMLGLVKTEIRSKDSRGRTRHISRSLGFEESEMVKELIEKELSGEA